MQHVNDDMDELFRRAAENYPLNTDSADWNAVAKKISFDKPEEEKAIVKNKNYKRLLWLLLLLPLGWGYERFFISNDNTPSHSALKNSINTNLSPASSSKNIDPKLSSVNPKFSKANTISANNSVALITSSVIKRKANGKIHSTIYQNSSETFIPEERSSIISDPSKELQDEKQHEADLKINNKEIVDNKNETSPVDLNEKKETANANDEVKKKNSTQKTRKQNERGLYAGIMIGPDVSTVKFQSIKNIGVSMGLLIGYQFNNKVSLQSGVSWSIKNYYSDGTYFSLKNISIPANLKIKNVDGVCNMIEVPVNVKYNLTAHKTAISISAGVSSYFMKKEKYVYAIENSGQQYDHSSTYNNSANNILAVANLCFGYNRKLKHNITFRVEPYLKIPLKGMGIGELPIMSTGVNIGITKKISR